MIYLVSRIRTDVRTALDENKTERALLMEQDQETLDLDALIISKIEEAAKRVELIAPHHLLESGHNFGDSIHWERERQTSNLAGWTLLPSDFMRLVAFKMSDWERTLFEAITPSDPLYLKQNSRYGGVRGNPQKPVVAIVNRPEGLALEFYSCRSEAAYTEKAFYLPYPKIDADGGIDICERCYNSVVYMTAALILTAYGDAQKAAIFETNALTALGIVVNNQAQ